MKIRALLLVSFCLNLGLFGAYWVAKRASEPDSATLEFSSKTDPQSPSPRPGSRPGKGSTTVSIEEFPFDWSRVESEDFRQFISNMRSIGVPEETIRDIIIAEINKIYAAKVNALYPPPSTFEFWKASTDRGGRGGRGGGPGGPGGRVVPTSREIEAQVRALDTEKRDVIKELLGISMETAMKKWNGRPSDEDYRLAFLTAEKREQVRSLQERLQNEQRSIWGDDSIPNEEKRAKFLALRDAQSNELKSLLTPREYEDYQLRTSRTAERMRATLGSFEASEQEFREIFRLRSDFEDRFFGQDMDDQTRQAAEAALQRSLANTLGQDRYTEYQLSQDDRYRNIHDFAQRNELPTETARAIYDIQSVVEQERQQILSDASLAAQDRELILAAMAQETQQVLASTLGPELYETYSSRDGRWVSRITSTEQGGRRGGGDMRGGPGGGRGGRGGR